MKAQFTVASLFSLGGFVGCPACDVGADNVTVEGDDVAGDANSETNIDDVAVDDVEADVDADVDVTNSAVVVVEVGVGDEDADEEADSDVVVAANEGVGFTYDYQGIIDEHADLVPSSAFDDLVEVEWVLRAVRFGEPTIIDDAAGFDWGEPQFKSDAVEGLEDDAGDEYVLAAFFGDDALQPLRWGTDSSFCDTGCHRRAIIAACAAEIVLRVTRVDGSVVEAVAEHRGARPTCWE